MSTPTHCPGHKYLCSHHDGLVHIFVCECPGCQGETPRLTEQEREMFARILAWLRTPTHLQGEQWNVVQALASMLWNHFPLDRPRGETPATAIVEGVLRASGTPGPDHVAVEKPPLGGETPAPRALTLTEKERGQVEMARAEMRRVQACNPPLTHWLDRNIRAFALGDRERLLAILDRLCPSEEG